LLRHRFLVRNRLIAGLTRGTVVVGALVYWPSGSRLPVPCGRGPRPRSGEHRWGRRGR